MMLEFIFGLFFLLIWLITVDGDSGKQDYKLHVELSQIQVYPKSSECV